MYSILYYTLTLVWYYYYHIIYVDLILYFLTAVILYEFSYLIYYSNITVVKKEISKTDIKQFEILERSRHNR